MIPAICRRSIVSVGLALILTAVQGCGSADRALDKTAAPQPADSSLPPPTENPATPAPAAPAAATPGTPAVTATSAPTTPTDSTKALEKEHTAPQNYSSLLFVFMLSTFIGLGVILRVSRLLHTPLMSLTNAISAIAVVGSIIVTGSEGYPPAIRLMGGVALFASMTNIVSGFLITDRMLKMFKAPGQGGKR
jgi:NAD(P) transhydrogenase subunit alpha